MFKGLIVTSLCRCRDPHHGQCANLLRFKSLCLIFKDKIFSSLNKLGLSSINDYILSFINSNLIHSEKLTTALRPSTEDVKGSPKADTVLDIHCHCKKYLYKKKNLKLSPSVRWVDSSIYHTRSASIQILRTLKEK